MPTENNPMKSAIDRRLSALCVPDDMARRIQAAAQKKGRALSGSAVPLPWWLYFA